MNTMQELFASPDFFPMKIDVSRKIVSFVRMSRNTYRDSVFLDGRTKYLGAKSYEARLDDLLFMAASSPKPTARVHFILHTTFCCSTLLARYFELAPSCFVLKEPGLLTQLALLESVPRHEWNGLFDLCMRLLTRTYEADQLVVIKPHEPCNILGDQFLDHSRANTISFVMTALRQFVLAILKSDFRRKWVRTRIPFAGNASGNPALMNIDPRSLTDSEAAAYLWLVNRYLCEKLVHSQPARVLRIDGEYLAQSPEPILRSVFELCTLPEPALTESLSCDQPMSRYSKDVSRAYDGRSRQEEMTSLEARFGTEADAACKWAEVHPIATEGEVGHSSRAS
jgi:hypothetical protein